MVGHAFAQKDQIGGRVVGVRVGQMRHDHPFQRAPVAPLGRQRIDTQRDLARLALDQGEAGEMLGLQRDQPGQAVKPVMLAVQIAAQFAILRVGPAEHADRTLAVMQQGLARRAAPKAQAGGLKPEIPILVALPHPFVEAHARIQHPAPDQAARVAGIGLGGQQQVEFRFGDEMAVLAEEIEFGIEPVGLFPARQQMAHPRPRAFGQHVVGVQQEDRVKIGVQIQRRGDPAVARPAEAAIPGMQHHHRRAQQRLPRGQRAAGFFMRAAVIDHDQAADHAGLQFALDRGDGIVDQDRMPLDGDDDRHMPGAGGGHSSASSKGAPVTTRRPLNSAQLRSFGPSWASEAARKMSARSRIGSEGTQCACAQPSAGNP